VPTVGAVVPTVRAVVPTARAVVPTARGRCGDGLRTLPDATWA
jgi:hypothetical protein